MPQYQKKKWIILWLGLNFQNPSAVKKTFGRGVVRRGWEQLSYYSLAQVGLKLKILPLSQVSVGITDVCN